ncbi:MAG TPA: hypothetical protein VHO90_00335 [Bacteroidales bacterium]|nr:hypothetical protein [Bacteroidales bacterium]
MRSGSPPLGGFRRFKTALGEEQAEAVVAYIEEKMQEEFNKKRTPCDQKRYRRSLTNDITFFHQKEIYSGDLSHLIHIHFSLQ